MLALLLHVPLFAILSAIYVLLPRAQRSLQRKTLFDTAVIAISALVSVTLMLWVSNSQAGVHQGIWLLVLDALVLFHSFPVLLGLAWWLRPRVLSAGRWDDRAAEAQYR